MPGPTDAPVGRTFLFVLLLLRPGENAEGRIGLSASILLVRGSSDEQPTDEVYFLLEDGKFREIADFDSDPGYRKMWRRARPMRKPRP